jgi:hypothetical protein
LIQSLSSTANFQAHRTATAAAAGAGATFSKPAVLLRQQQSVRCPQGNLGILRQKGKKF